MPDTASATFSVEGVPPTPVPWPWESWDARYYFRWAALEATIDYYSTHMDEWDD